MAELVDINNQITEITLNINKNGNIGSCNYRENRQITMMADSKFIGSSVKASHVSDTEKLALVNKLLPQDLLSQITAILQS